MKSGVEQLYQYCTTSGVRPSTVSLGQGRSLMYTALLWRVPQHAGDGPDGVGVGCEGQWSRTERSSNIKLDIEQERESVFQDRNISILFDISSHIKDQVKEVYLDTSAMDDEQLLMQFFKKRDTDNNMKLDGLELLRALVDMEGETNKTLPNIIIALNCRGREPPSRRSWE